VLVGATFRDDDLSVLDAKLGAESRDSSRLEQDARHHRAQYLQEGGTYVIPGHGRVAMRQTSWTIANGRDIR